MEPDHNRDSCGARAATEADSPVTGTSGTVWSSADCAGLLMFEESSLMVGAQAVTTRAMTTSKTKENLVFKGHLFLSTNDCLTIIFETARLHKDYNGWSSHLF